MPYERFLFRPLLSKLLYPLLSTVEPALSQRPRRGLSAGTESAMTAVDTSVEDQAAMIA